MEFLSLSELSAAASGAVASRTCMHIYGDERCAGEGGMFIKQDLLPCTSRGVLCGVCVCSETRTAGTAINTFTNLLMTFVVGQTFLSMLCAMKFGVSTRLQSTVPDTYCCTALR
jgi:hypothetical protein